MFLLLFSEALNKSYVRSLFYDLFPFDIKKSTENLRLSQLPAQHDKLLCGVTENMETSLKPSKDENVLFYSMLPDFRISTALWKVPRPRPFVLVRATCRRK
jgi:hypothetical protein